MVLFFQRMLEFRRILKFDNGMDHKVFIKHNATKRKVFATHHLQSIGSCKYLLPASKFHCISGSFVITVHIFLPN